VIQIFAIGSESSQEKFLTNNSSVLPQRDDVRMKSQEDFVVLLIFLKSIPRASILSVFNEELRERTIILKNFATNTKLLFLLNAAIIECFLKNVLN